MIDPTPTACDVLSNRHLGRKKSGPAVVALMMSLVLSACATEAAQKQPPSIHYVFDIGEAKKAYKAGVAAEKRGESKAAVALFQRAIDLFPVYEDAYSAMVGTAKRIGDQQIYRYALFFDARMASITKLGPRLSARAFENIARDTPSNRVKEPEIRRTAGRIVAFLDAVVCEEAHHQDQASKEKMSPIARYGLEGLILHLEEWSADPTKDCPDATIR